MVACASWTTIRPCASPCRHRDPDPGPLVSIVIPTRDRVDLLRTVDSVLSLTDYPRFEIVVIDNDSRDPATLDWLAESERLHRVRVVPSLGPFNYSRLMTRLPGTPGVRSSRS